MDFQNGVPSTPKTERTNLLQGPQTFRLNLKIGKKKEGTSTSASNSIRTSKPNLDLNSRISDFLSKTSYPIEDYPEDLTAPINKPKKKPNTQEIVRKSLIYARKSFDSRKSGGFQLDTFQDNSFKEDIKEDDKTNIFANTVELDPFDDYEEVQMNASLFPQVMDKSINIKNVCGRSPTIFFGWFIKSILNNATFYRCHFSFFIFISFLSSFLIYAIEDISYVDALFMSTSAMCVTGLTVVDFGFNLLV